MKALKRILPKDHPFLKKLDYIPTGADDEPNHMNEILNGVIDVIDDWKRGIRDWDEVENELVLAREAII